MIKHNNHSKMASQQEESKAILNIEDDEVRRSNKKRKRNEMEEVEIDSQFAGDEIDER